VEIDVDRYVKPYVDSSVFIAWIHKEVVAGVDRFAIADHVIKKAERGEYPIYISALTLSEVHKLPRGTTPALTPEQDDMIIRFFQNDLFKVLPVDRDIGEAANRLCRDYGIHGNDATHLACALRAKCDVLLVWDRPLATKVQRADIRIESPQILGQQILNLSVKTEANTDAENNEPEQGVEPAEDKPVITEDTAGLRRDDEGAPTNAAGAEEKADDSKAAIAKVAESPVNEATEIVPPAAPPKPSPASGS
jgi:predicted nucleic acid-binding protein